MEQNIKIQFEELKKQMVELAKKDNGLKELTPFMGNDKTLSSASYMLRLKRVQLEKQESENKVESLINDYLTVAKEYVNTESNEEIGLAIKEIKQEIFNVCEDIKNNVITTTSEVNSKLDLTTFYAINLDFIFDELYLTYNFLNKQKVYKLNLQTLTLLNKKHKECVKQNETINNIIISQLTLPIKALKQKQVKKEDIILVVQ